MNTYFKKILIWWERRTRQFITFHVRPHYADNIDTNSEDNGIPKMAVVMQGPLAKEDSFTLETLKIYEKHFKNSILILSTWEDEDPAYLDQIRDATQNVQIILNKKPTNPGISHINFQIISTLAGITLARKIGAEYILKTRTDFRMYAPNISAFLYSLIKTFPATPGFKQKERIVVSSLITFKYRPYSPTDLTMYGNIDDMIDYWSVPLDERREIPPNIESMREWSQARMCEVYLSARYLEKIGRTLTWTLSDSLDAYRKHFIVADASSLDIYWRKYEHHTEFRRLYYDTDHTDQLLDFKAWLLLYRHEGDFESAKGSIVDLPLGSKI